MFQEFIFKKHTPGQVHAFFKGYLRHPHGDHKLIICFRALDIVVVSQTTPNTFMNIRSGLWNESARGSCTVLLHCALFT